MSPDGGHDNAPKHAGQLLDFARQFSADWSERSLEPKELVDFAAKAVPHAIGVGLTLVKSDGQPMTLAASNDLAEIVDHIEYECGEGPCLDAIEYDDVTVSNDLAKDERWPKFVERAVAETPVRSMFGARIFLGGKERGALNFYANEVDAFGQLDLGIGAMLSVIASVALQHANEQRRRENLEVALESSRVIGMAMGIVMSSRLVTADQAFEALRRASQESNRKLRDVAAEVTETGLLPERRNRPADKT
jgi:ANTAR domain-containing protein/GAF domain-containing protein